MTSIALCISGQPRSVEKGYEYYKKNLLDHYDVDVFFHTWYSEEAKKVETLYKPKGGKIDLGFTPEQIESINKKYTNTPDAHKWPPYYTVSAYCSMYRCCLYRRDYETFKTEKPYDWVIKTRFDFALPERIPFDKLEKNTLYMPDCRTRAFGDWLGNDQFAVGDSNIMNMYMSTYLHLDTYYGYGIQMIGEEMLRANLLQNGLKEKIKYLDMERPFPPGPRNGTPHFLIRDDILKWTNQ